MTKKLIIPIAVCMLALLVASSGRAGATKDSFDLKGEVYPNFKIEMKNSANRPLAKIAAGVHTIKIEDKSSIHNFHLVGPGVNKSTSVAGTGERVWTVRLRAGKYTYFCDPHSSEMRGSFRVTG